jgi:hypothetical protein
MRRLSRAAATLAAIAALAGGTTLSGVAFAVPHKSGGDCVDHADHGKGNLGDPGNGGNHHNESNGKGNGGDPGNGQGHFCNDV